MHFRHTSSEICSNLGGFWKNNYYIPCTGLSTEDASTASETSQKSQTHIPFCSPTLNTNCFVPNS